jgi:hypothetical protein
MPSRFKCILLLPALHLFSPLTLSLSLSLSLPRTRARSLSRSLALASPPPPPPPSLSLSHTLSLTLTHSLSHHTAAELVSDWGQAYNLSLPPHLSHTFLTHYPAALLVRDRGLTRKPTADIFDHVQRLRGGARKARKPFPASQ